MRFLDNIIENIVPVYFKAIETKNIFIKTYKNIFPFIFMLSPEMPQLHTCLENFLDICQEWALMK
jgi:hypothetical protein